MKIKIKILFLQVKISEGSTKVELKRVITHVNPENIEAITVEIVSAETADPGIISLDESIHCRDGNCHIYQHEIWVEFDLIKIILIDTL